MTLRLDPPAAAGAAARPLRLCSWFVAELLTLEQLDPRREADTACRTRPPAADCGVQLQVDDGVGGHGP